MKILVGKKLVDFSFDELKNLINQYQSNNYHSFDLMSNFVVQEKTSKGIIIDLGCGDAKFSYLLAKNNPDKLIIGVEPLAKNMLNISVKAKRNLSKGGVTNLLLVVADIHFLPQELSNIANQVFINFPWSSLLYDLVLAKEDVLTSLVSIGKRGCFFNVVFGYDQNQEGVKIEKFNLPVLNGEYVNNILFPKLTKFGLKLIDFFPLEHEIIKKYPTSWAKRLRENKERHFFYLKLKKI